MTYVVTPVLSLSASVGETGLAVTLSLQLCNYSSTALQLVSIEQNITGARNTGGRWPVPQYGSTIILPAVAANGAPGILNLAASDVFYGATNPNSGVSLCTVNITAILSDGNVLQPATTPTCTFTVGCPGFYTQWVAGQAQFNAQQQAVFAPLIH